MRSVILTGWKEISRYLRYGVRTVQRWEERERVPVRRVTGSPHSPVVADSEELDEWILRRSRIPEGAPQDLIANLRRARELQIEIQETRKDLILRSQRLKEQIAEFRGKKETKIS